jgi:hypothetical protein
VNLIPRRCNATRVEEGRPCQPAREDRLRLRPGPLTRVRGSAWRQRVTRGHGFAHACAVGSFE